MAGVHHAQCLNSLLIQAGTTGRHIVDDENVEYMKVQLLQNRNKWERSEDVSMNIDRNKSAEVLRV